MVSHSLSAHMSLSRSRWCLFRCFVSMFLSQVAVVCVLVVCLCRLICRILCVCICSVVSFWLCLGLVLWLCLLSLFESLRLCVCLLSARSMSLPMSLYMALCMCMCTIKKIRYTSLNDFDKLYKNNISFSKNKTNIRI